MDSPDRFWLTTPLGLLYAPLLLSLVVLWYLTISFLLTWLKEKKRPDRVWQLLVALGVLMATTRSIWFGSLHIILITATIFWVMTHGKEKLFKLAPSLRLKYCTPGSTALAGAFAALTIICIAFLVRFSDQTLMWGQPLKLAATTCVAAMFGVVAGLARKHARRRWPEPVQTGYVGSGWGGFYFDEVILPVVFTPFIWGGLMLLDYGWSIIFGWGIMALPLMVLLTMPLYAIWAWFHTGLLGWLGTIERKQFMEYEAYEAVIWDDHIQQWLGDLKITADQSNNEYVLTGMLPDRMTLNSIRLRLQDIHQATVDATAVTIDPTIEPDYARLKAFARRGTYGMRRRTG
jgi:hypothetical protein